MFAWLVPVFIAFGMLAYSAAALCLGRYLEKNCRPTVMRFRLRTLMILLAVVPPFVAVMWWTCDFMLQQWRELERALGP